MIKKLPSNLINQIAAGEVVDDPASIIKELIENSIDANATEINIYIEKGGLKSIIIEDNGDGIKKNYLLNAFERHATSKISKLDDLNKISTLGFRGEALPSISSVSRVKIKSKHHSSAKGYQVDMSSASKEVIPSSIDYGTTIEVRELFYNTPARKKFLSSENKEYRKIIQLFKTISISNYATSFKFNHNGKNIYQFKKGKLIDRISSIYGQDFAESCLEVKFNKDIYKISGYIGNLSLVKNRSGNQYLFINNRPIKNQLINLAIYNAYRSLIERGEYPSFFLFLDLPGSTLDVNVHPKKNEVKFDNELQVQYVFKKSVSDSLSNIKHVIPAFTKENNFDNFEKAELNFDDQKVIQTNILSIKEETNSDIDIKKAEIRLNKFSSEPAPSLQSKNIWQIHNKYIITEITSGLIIIDQHVAHERVLYETALKALEGDGMPSQSILFPKTIDFDPETYSYAIELFYYLEKIGFKYRSFGESSIIIEGVPSDLDYGKEDEVINDIIEKYAKTKKASSSFIDYIAATYACKAAIKAGDKLSEIECKELIDQLFATEHPYYCPHGRPIIVNLGIEDIDKRFERH